MAHIIVVGKIGVKGRIGKGEYSRNSPSWEDVETPPVPREELALHPSPLWAETYFFFPFRKMQNFVKCLRFPSHVRSLYQPLSRKRLTLVSFLGICSFTNEFIAASCSYKGLLLLLCYFLFQALLLRCSVSLVDY